MEELYYQATLIAQQSQQIVGEKHDYYITLEQLMNLIQSYQQLNQK